MEMWVSTLVNLSVGFPVYLVLIVGMILAAMRRREAPTRYGLVLAALALHLIVGMGGSVFSTLLPVLIMRGDASPSSFAGVFGIVGVVISLAQAVGWLLLLAALFWRGAADDRRAVEQVRP
ncbi:hypothetical protein V3W47_04950 [Deinococcus sp. YIM 134068]|uniref:hypothetical protein n=1 Tax=Deinococcus lichenicola TaxID=3118910 RepID=UPI002F939755